MSFPVDIEDLKTSELRAEVTRRDNLVAQRKCPYCGVDLLSHSCRYKGKEAHYHDEDANGNPVKYPNPS